ncbi:MAG: twin-arginine translocase TatA/TatE family subunit [Hyphomicrobiales bacterium]
MGVSFWQILIVVALLVLLFGRGKISGLMGDVAKGIKSFKKGIQEEPQEETTETADELKTIEHETAEAVDAPKKAAGSKAKT